MHQLPIEVRDHDDNRLLEIKQLLSLHDPEDFVTVVITKEQIPDLIKALQSRLKQEKKAAPAAPVETKFESHFWSRYPASKRKVDRIGCERHWIANNLDEHADLIADAIGICADDPEWKKENGAFIPMPKTWLHQRRWEAAAPGTSGTNWNGMV